MKQSSARTTPGVDAIKGTWRQQAGAAGIAWRSLSEDLAGVGVDGSPQLEGEQPKPVGAGGER